MSCDFARPRRLDNQPHTDARPRQHIDQRIGAEQVDPSAQKTADAGLRDSKDSCCLGLLEPLRSNGPLHLNQQIEI